ncbi:MAG: hypothetical protein J0652_02550 [Desulfobulbaceae bacterium]|nr:hypothetical protein [Desulfobulbaceae bacterium]
MEDCKVYHRHLRSLGYCNSGLRKWFAREGVDWQDFLDNGISCAWLRSKNNAMATRAVELAEREAK